MNKPILVSYHYRKTNGNTEYRKYIPLVPNSRESLSWRDCVRVSKSAKRKTGIYILYPSGNVVSAK